MKIDEKRKTGEILGRIGIAQRIALLAANITSYKHSIEVGGQIKVLIESASYDEYWTEKALHGAYKEETYLKKIIEKNKNK